MTDSDFERELARLARRPHHDAGEDRGWDRVRARTVDEDIGRGAAPLMDVRLREQGVGKGERAAFAGGSSPRALRRYLAYATVAIIPLLVAPVVQHRERFARFKQAPPPMREYSTAAGQRARITLPDNSTAILAPHSRIRYNTRFGASSHRDVILEGQALFTVTQSSGAPFVVRTGSVSTKVLGTTFSVRRYAGDTATRVIVAQGRVAVNSAALSTGDVGTTVGSAPPVIVRGTDIPPQLAWADGRLAFSSVPLRHVIPELERWYGITIEVTDPALLNRTVLATFETESAARAIELIAFVTVSRAELRGNRAIIHSH